MNDGQPPTKTPPSTTEAPRALTVIERRALQQRYAQASQIMQQPEYDCQEAHVPLAECVAADPGNAVYVRALLENLRRKSDGRGKRFWASGTQSQLAKAAGGNGWGEVLRLGPAALLDDPRDANAVSFLAQACDAYGYEAAAAAYLQYGLEFHPQDGQLNRLAARSSARRGCFEEAIEHWQQVERTDPRDDEAPRMIAALTLEKVRRAASDEAPPEPAEETPPRRSDVAVTPAAPAPSRPRTLVLTPRQQLERAIAANPEDLHKYLELADLHITERRLFDAQQTLAKAVSVSPELRVIEKLEDVNVLRAREQVEIAKRRAEEERTAEALDLVDKLLEETLRLELEIARIRCDRYPEDKALRFELGLRLKRAGRFRQALEPLQAGLDVPEHRPEASLEIGEILQRYKQFPKALQCYRQSVQLAAADPRHQECRKTALYRAGVLATAMGLHDSARQYLTELVRVDPSYRDAKARIEELNELGDGF